MTKEEAMQLLRQVCAIYRGTLSEHNSLQEALNVISELIIKSDKNENKEAKNK